MQCVQSDEKTMAIGLQSLIQVLGAIPGPIIVGYFIDKSCLTWNSLSNDDSDTRSCELFSNFQFALGISLFCVTAKACSLFFILTAAFIEKQNSASNNFVWFTEHKETYQVTEMNDKLTSRS